MAKMQKSEKVTLKYQGNKIFIDGPGIKGVLFIRFDELYKMYYGETGTGSLDVALELPEVQTHG